MNLRDAIKKAKHNLPLIPESIGQGSSRIAYEAMAGKFCYKIAKDERGLAQNEAEVVLFDRMTDKERKRYAKIVGWCPDFSWVKMELVQSVTSANQDKWKIFENGIEEDDEKYSYCNANDIGSYRGVANCGLRGEELVAYDYGFSEAVSELY